MIERIERVLRRAAEPPIASDEIDPAAPVEVTNTYSTGAVQSTGQLLDGEMHGDWAFYRKDGSMMRSGCIRPRRPGGRVADVRSRRRLVKETRFPDPA